MARPLFVHPAYTGEMDMPERSIMSRVPLVALVLLAGGAFLYVVYLPRVNSTAQNAQNDIDVSVNGVVRKNVDLEDLGREIGALADHETLAQEEGK